MQEKSKKCKYKYYNNNPLNRQVNDCVIRSIALCEGRSWDEVYLELSEIARLECILLDDVTFVEKYLNERYEKVKYRCNSCETTVKEISEILPEGSYLVTMNNHITCLINHIIFDIWDCRFNKMWGVWKIK